VDGLHAELVDWLAVWAPAATSAHREVLAALGVNSILGARFASSVFRRSEAPVADESYLAEWTAVLAARVRSLS
jgi:hypothetical protein